MPEAGVEQVQHRVLDAADVEVDAAWIVLTVRLRAGAGPVALVFQVDELFSVVRVDVAQLVPGGTCPVRHDVGVTAVLLLAIAEIELDIDPVSGLVQWSLWLGVGIVRVEGDRLVVLDLWQLDRKHGLGQRVGVTVLVIDDGEGLAPVALAGE